MANIQQVDDPDNLEDENEEQQFNGGDNNIQQQVDAGLLTEDEAYRLAMGQTI